MYNKYIRIIKTEDKNLNYLLDCMRTSDIIKDIDVRKEYIIGEDHEGNEFVIQYHNDSNIELEVYIRARNVKVVEGISELLMSNCHEYSDGLIEDKYSLLNDIRNNTKTIKNGVIILTTIIVVFTLLLLFSL